MTKTFLDKDNFSGYINQIFFPNGLNEREIYAAY